MTTSSLSFRNVVRYATNVEKTVPLYEAVGFHVVRQMEGFAIMEAENGPRLILHGADEVKPMTLGTALGFTAHDPEAARQHVENAGWRLMRAPDEEDEGLFWIYEDLDGNTINLVGQRPGS